MDKIYFDNVSYDKFEEYLWSLGEGEYLEFNRRIIPDMGMAIGIRMPMLRDLARKLSKNDNLVQMINLLDKSEIYEVKLLEGMLIGNLDCNHGEFFMFVDRYLTRIDNWAICDAFVTNLKKQVLVRQNVFYERIKTYIMSEEPYNIRFGLIILNCYYNNKDYIGEILDYIERVNSEHYYVKMGIAWLLSTIYFTNKAAIIDYLKSTKISKWCVNKAIQKICESLKTSELEKKEIRLLKI